MQRILTRATQGAMLSGTVGAVLPFFGVLLWLSTRQDLVDAWLSRPVWARAADLAVVLMAMTLLGVIVATMVARRAARAITGPIDVLSQRAELVGGGEAVVSFEPIGIAELDLVSDALARSAQRLSRALATERSFASDASHQLRTPLTALTMRIEEIATTDSLDVAHEEAGVALAQVDRLGRVVDDLLQRRRSDPAGRLPEVSLDTVIATLQREWQPAFETARRSVRVHGERGLVVRATPIAMSQILSTLLENSLVHGRGTVDVHARRSGPSAVVEVRDEGDGIPAALAPHIFERSVSSGQGSSTGLGLALARDLAESCGGRLDLIARTPATFAVFLSEARDGYQPTASER